MLFSTKLQYYSGEVWIDCCLEVAGGGEEVVIWTTNERNERQVVIWTMNDRNERNNTN